MSEWKPGLPPGKYYEGMVDDFEVYFSPGGLKWHRRLTPIVKHCKTNDENPSDSKTARK